MNGIVIFFQKFECTINLVFFKPKRSIYLIFILNKLRVKEVKINLTIDIFECEVNFVVALNCAICDMVVKRFSNNYTSFLGKWKVFEFDCIFHFIFFSLIFNVVSGPLFFFLNQVLHKNFKLTISFSFLNSPISNNLVCFCFKLPIKEANRFTISFWEYKI